MKISFRTNLTAKDTECFEAIYEPELQLESADKDEILQNGIAAWILVDGKLAGESYGICPADLDEEIEDIEGRPKNAFYIYSTTILPEFQGMKLGKLLRAFLHGLILASGKYDVICGHATSPAMVAINEFFGAEFVAHHEEWYGTKRTAHFYRIQTA